ncbi:MAG: glycosyltransferase family 87 protein [Hyphomicrobiaceae bacterium]
MSADVAIPAPRSDSRQRRTTAAWDDRLVALLCLGSLCLFAPIAKAVYWPAGGGLDVTGHQIGRDFINFWAAPQIAFGATPGSLFDLSQYNREIRALFGAPIPFHMWSYPPVVLLAAWGFATLPYGLALAAWVIGGFAVFARVVASALPAGRGNVGLLALALAPATLINVAGGQNGFLSGALMVGALLVHDRKPVLAGVLLGLLTFKPQLGIAVPFALLALGAWRTLAAATLTALAWYGASVAVLGLDFWQSYIDYTATYQASVVYNAENFWSSMMMSPMAAAMALGAGAKAAGLMQIGIAAVVIAATMLAVRATDDRLIRMLVIVSAVPLVPHQVFNYDLPMLSAAWLLVMLNPAYRVARVGAIASLVWLSPLLTMLAFFLKVPAVAQLILCAGFAASVVLAFEHARASRQARHGRSAGLAA